MTGKRAIDRTGQRFGRLVVLGRDYTRNRGAFWLCRCDCGKTTVAPSGHLTAGMRVSCGCAQDGSYNVKHGMSHSPEYRAWENARSRCRNPKNRKYPLYGGRGITMCEQWATSFDAFLADVGRRPSAAYSLDRIDGDRGYEPGNCRWATIDVQNRNRVFGRESRCPEA
jgi:hypothetical protein